MRRRYIQDPKTGKLIPAALYRRHDRIHYIQGEIEPFRSHVDGTMITSRRELREHNERNGVVDGGEVLQDQAPHIKAREDYYAGRPHDTERRTDALKFAVELHERGRTPADIHQMAENYRERNK